MKKEMGTGEIAQKTKPKRKDAYHHGDLRQHLVESSRALIAAHGSDRFSISAACREAGVSTAAPYRHFSDKTDILIAVKIDGFRRLKAAFEEAVAQHPRGTHEAISALGEAYVTFAAAEPNVFRLLFSHVEEHANKEALTGEGHSCFGVLLQEVALFLRREDVDEAVKRAAFPLWTFVHGASFLVIDQLVEVTELDVDIAALVDDATVRLLGQRPDPETENFGC